MNVILHIENLSASITEEEMKTLFTEIGEAMAVELNRHRSDEGPKKRRLSMQSALDEADKAIGKFNIYSFNGRTWKVRLPMPQLQQLLKPVFEP
jgi:hypothetical protein